MHSNVSDDSSSYSDNHCTKSWPLHQLWLVDKLSRLVKTKHFEWFGNVLYGASSLWTRLVNAYKLGGIISSILLVIFTPTKAVPLWLCLQCLCASLIIALNLSSSSCSPLGPVMTMKPRNTHTLRAEPLSSPRGRDSARRVKHTSLCLRLHERTPESPRQRTITKKVSRSSRAHSRTNRLPP